MSKPQRLPVGDSSFESIRANNCVYVDKTQHLFRMADEGKYYFMSRPRRFGKSLTVSTLRCMFQGKKDLFEGLWIADNPEWEWKPYPVVFFDFNGISHDTPENMKLSLQRTMQQAAEANDISSDAPCLRMNSRNLFYCYIKKPACRLSF